MPWTKLALLRGCVEAASVETWLALAERVSLRVLAAHVRQVQRGEVPELRVSKSFAVRADAETVLEAALEEIGRAAGTEDRGRQLELLAADGLGTRHAGVAPGVRPWAVLLDPVARERLQAALALTRAASTAEAMRALAEHALGCPLWPSEHARGPQPVVAEQ